jgi:hypothetical protein
MTAIDYVIAITDGTTTITLTSSYSIRAYAPRAADPAESTVTETIEILARGNAYNNLTNLRTLNALLYQAEQAQKNRDLARVYLTIKAGSSETTYRSEIVRARGEWGEDTLSLVRWTKGAQWAALFIERRNWWEGPEAQIPLTNGSSTGNTGGITVYNHDDAGTGHDNFVSIAAAAVTGDLPAPTRLEMTNTYNAASRTYDLWIGHGYQIDTATFNHILEAEDGGAGDVNNAGASGGKYLAVTLSNTLETTIRSWTITGAQLNAAKGRFFKAIARFADSTGLASVRYRLKVVWNVSTLWESAQAYPDTNRAIIIRDLTTFRLPPWLEGLGSQDSVDLVLTGQVVTAPVTINLDFLQLTPVDGWRYIIPKGYGAPYNTRIVDDGIDGRIYVDDGAGASKAGIFIGYGSPIMLQPNKLQRLYFLQHSSSIDTAQIDRTLSIKLFYRPRRLTL